MKINYVTGRTSEFGELRQSIPVHLESGGFMLCTSGCGDVVVDSRLYSVKAGDLVVGFPHSHAHAIHTSADFDGIILGVDIDTLINTDVPDKSFYITAITANPCISLCDAEVQRIVGLREAFVRESGNVDHPLRGEIDEAMLKIIIYEVAALFRHSTPNVDHKISRDDAIFNNFLLHLYADTSYHRDVDYFASLQSITSSHLSKVVKRVSSRTASEWICEYIVMSIKRLLQSGDIQIGEVAQSLNFPNASFMAQYFKLRTGQTPKQYRAEFFGA